MEKFYPKLFQRKWLLNHLAWRGSNKTLSLSLKQHRPGSIADAFTFAVPMVFGSVALTLMTFVLVVTGCTFQLMGPVFLNSFQKFTLRG